MRPFLAAFCAAMVCLSAAAAGQEVESSPKLLLTPQRLRRLQRDRQRQTARWANFEKRVRTVPDSSERGFELALYYAVTHDEERGREAVQWALAHRCEVRQGALVLDWAGELVSPDQRRQFGQAICAQSGPPREEPALRDFLFLAIAKGDLKRADWENANQTIVSELAARGSIDPISLYATAEYLMAVRTIEHTDLRESAPQFFSSLPKAFLLSLKPASVEKPEWMTHIAALALVSLDPNLEGSQFLQGWAMEDRQMLRDGPGVAYEFLWADPYLPGIAYQNMDPWIYDPAGRLVARADWNPGACWISVSPVRQEQQNCTTALMSQPAQFGTLTLRPMLNGCTNLVPRKNNESAILWQLKPKQEITFERGQKRVDASADPAGMWPASADVTGKICVDRRDRQ